MSGIEVAALILGAIPVVIEAFDYSTQLFEPFRKYRRYVRDVQKLEFQIRTQRSIFVNNCVILLSSITGSEERAREMLQSLSLATSSDEIRRRLSSCRLESLGISLVACQDTIANLRASLDSLNKELVLFRTRSLGTSTGSDAREIHWYQDFGKRIKFEINRNNYKEQVGWIEKLNSNFDLLCRNVKEQFRQPEGISREKRRSVLNTTAEIMLLERIRQAYQDFYQVMAHGWNCVVHDLHSVHVCPKDDIGSGEYRAERDQIRLRIAITFHDECGYQERPLLLQADFSNQNQIPPAMALDSLTGSLAETAASLDSCATEILPKQFGSIPQTTKSSKYVRFEGLSSVKDEYTAQSRCSPSTDDRFTDDKGDDCNLEDFQDLTSFLVHGKLNPRKQACLNCLESPVLHKFMVCRAETDTMTTTSLNSLITSIMGMEKENVLLPLQKYRLAAGILKIALQFHSTPWLKENWRSSDIHFFDPGFLQRQILSRQMIHLRVDFNRHTPRDVKGKSVYHGSEPSDTFLFHLGVVFFELALTKPWSVLRQETIQELPNDMCRDYDIAKHLIPKLLRPMGPAYVRVIRKFISHLFYPEDSHFISEYPSHKTFVEAIRELQSFQQQIPRDIHVED